MRRKYKPVLLSSSFFFLASIVNGLLAVGQTHVDRLSVTSLLVGILSKGTPIGTATGFVVEKGQNYYLITNWHVVTCRNPVTNQSLDRLGRTPDQIVILQNAKGKLGTWISVREDLLDRDAKPLWIEHPQLGSKVDVVAVPLRHLDGVELYPLDLSLANTNLDIGPTETVSIVGFPFGNTASAGLAIWKSGTIASDPDINYEGTPEFLIDATGRPGMSGSPVYARRIGSYMDTAGNQIVRPGITDKFLGVYAGDIDAGSEIGRVWKASVVQDIYAVLK
jgi:hypothetical protein